jgi:hypothetical protein
VKDVTSKGRACILDIEMEVCVCACRVYIFHQWQAANGHCCCFRVSNR